MPEAILYYLVHLVVWSGVRTFEAENSFSPYPRLYIAHCSPVLVTRYICEIIQFMTTRYPRALDPLGVRSMVWTWTGLCTST